MDPAMLAGFRSALSEITKKRLNAIDAMRNCGQLASCVATAPRLAEQVHAAGGEQAMVALLQKYQDKPSVCVPVLFGILEVTRVCNPTRATWPAADVQRAVDAICGVIRLHPMDLDVLRTSVEVLGMLGYDIKMKEKLVAAGARQLLVAALQAHAASPANYGLTYTINAVLMQLIMTTRLAPGAVAAEVGGIGTPVLHTAALALLESDAVETIVSLVNMHPTEWAVTKTAIFLLARLASVDGAHKRLLAAGAAAAIVAGIERHPSQFDLVLSGLQGLRYLAVDRDACIALVDAAAIVAVLKGVQHHSAKPDMAAAACLLIGTLVCGAPQPVVELVEASVPKFLGKLLMKHCDHAAASRAACIALSKLAAWSGNGVRSILAANDAIQGIFCALGRHMGTGDVVKPALVALKHLLTPTPASEGEAAYDAADARSRLAPTPDHRGILSMVLLGNAADAEAVLHACQVFGALCEDEEWRKFCQVSMVALSAADALGKHIGDGSAAPSAAGEAACALLTTVMTAESLAFFEDTLPTMLGSLVKALRWYSSASAAGATAGAGTAGLDKAQRVLDLLADLADDDAAAQHLVTAGVATALVSALGTFPGDAAIVSRACYVLIDVTDAELKGACAATLRAGAVPALVALLRDERQADDADMLYNALCVLSRILPGDAASRRKGGCADLDLAGFAATVLAVMERHAEDANLVAMAFEALQAVWELPLAGASCDAAVSLAAVADLVLKLVDDVDVVTAAGGAVRSVALALQGQELTAQGCDAATRAAKSLAAAMLHDGESDGVAEPACDALLHLARHSPAARSALASAAGVVTVLSNCVGVRAELPLGPGGSDDAAAVSAQRVVELALQALAQLALCQEVWTVEHRRHALEAVIAAVVDAFSTPAVVVAGCEVLTNLSSTDAQCEAVLAAGAVEGVPPLEAVLEAMSMHVGDADVAAAGCGVLRTWAAAAGCRPRLMASPAVPLLVGALCTHPLSARVAAAACAALRNLGATAEYRRALMAGGLGAAKAVVAVLSRPKQDAEDKELYREAIRAACGALFALACEPANIPELAGAGALAAVVGVLQRQVADARTAWSASGIAVKLLGGMDEAQRKELLTAKSVAAARAALVTVLSTHRGDEKIVAAAEAALKLAVVPE